MRKLRPKYKEPIPIQKALMAFFKAAGMRERFEENMAIAFWDTSVGKEVAGHTTPTKVKDGIMFVKVDEDVWRHELAFLKHEIIKKLNHKIGKRTIKEIKFY